MQCYRHPKIETVVSCGKCDRPICPKCMVPGPAGMRCPDCASLRKTALYKIPPARLALAIVAGLVTGIVGAAILSGISLIGFLAIFIGPIYGGVVAEAVLRAAGRKRGRVLEIIGVGSIALGAVVVYALPLLWGLWAAAHAAQTAPNVAPAPSPLIGFGFISYLWPLVGIGLAISTCYGRLKYL